MNLKKKAFQKTFFDDMPGQSAAVLCDKAGIKRRSRQKEPDSCESEGDLYCAG